MRTLEDYIIAIDARKASIVCFLRSVILSCSKEIEENTYNDTPSYYFNNYKFCYLNDTQKGIEVVFCDGNELSDPFHLLNQSTNNTYKTTAMYNSKKVEAYKLIALLQQALLINELKEIKFQYDLRQLNK
jgi:hypothetical protein